MPAHSSLGQKIVSAVMGVFLVTMLLLMLFPLAWIIIRSYIR
jgi:hypothetical protein